MPREYQFWVYILSSRSRNLYVGMTNKLLDRTEKHRTQVKGSHTATYRIHRLVYYEFHQYVNNAIRREKELKRWTRAQKFALIEKVNPTWEDLYTTLVPAEQQVPFGDDNKKSKCKNVGGDER